VLSLVVTIQPEILALPSACIDKGALPSFTLSLSNKFEDDLFVRAVCGVRKEVQYTCTTSAYQANCTRAENDLKNVLVISKNFCSLVFHDD
jgi:hypothetical protein